MFYLPLSLFNFIALLNFFIPFSTILLFSLLNVFIPLLHNFYYFPSSMFFYSSPPPLPPPPHFYCFPSSSSSFLLFSLLLLHHHHHHHLLLISIVFPWKDQKSNIRPLRPNSNVIVWFWPFSSKTLRRENNKNYVRRGIKTLRRENNKTVEKGIKKLWRAIKLKRERGK